jgi:hypothetical protein
MRLENIFPKIRKGQKVIFNNVVYKLNREGTSLVQDDESSAQFTGQDVASGKWELAPVEDSREVFINLYKNGDVEYFKTIEEANAAASALPEMVENLVETRKIEWKAK